MAQQNWRKVAPNYLASLEANGVDVAERVAYLVKATKAGRSIKALKNPELEAEKLALIAVAMGKAPKVAAQPSKAATTTPRASQRKAAEQAIEANGAVSPAMMKAHAVFILRHPEVLTLATKLASARR